MRRRDFGRLLAGLPFAAAAPAWAQQTRKDGPLGVGFVTMLNERSGSDFLATLRAGLADYGYTGARLNLQPMYADNDPDRIAGIVAELEKRGVDVIVTHAAATPIVVKTPRTKPVVYQLSADPVTVGLSRDLVHPDNNATGVTLMMAELNAKRLDLAREIQPDLKRIAVLVNPLHGGAALERQVVETKSRQLGIEPSFQETPTQAALESALERVPATRPDAILMFADAFVFNNQKHIADFAIRNRLPIYSGWAVMADAGAFCTFGPKLKEAFRRVAFFVDKIAQGKSPADLPIEQPSQFELVLNLQTARQIGVNVPPQILARADRVIE